MTEGLDNGDSDNRGSTVFIFSIQGSLLVTIISDLYSPSPLRENCCCTKYKYSLKLKGCEQMFNGYTGSYTGGSTEPPIL